jgi:hypothetical protein
MAGNLRTADSVVSPSQGGVSRVSDPSFGWFDRRNRRCGSWFMVPNRGCVSRVPGKRRDQVEGQDLARQQVVVC